MGRMELPPRRRRKRKLPRYCRMCSREIDTGKRGAPPAYCVTLPPDAPPGTPTCKELADARYMREYMRDYRAGKRRTVEPEPTGGPVPVAAVRRDT